MTQKSALASVKKGSPSMMTRAPSILRKLKQKEQSKNRRNLQLGDFRQNGRNIKGIRR